MTDEQNDPKYAEIVSNVMDIEDITWGDPKQDYLVRFRGQLTTGIVRAKDVLTDALADTQVSPIVRGEDDRHTILLISDPITTLVSQVMDIRDTSWAPADDTHLVRYLGELTTDSIEAYDFLSEELKKQEITALFREEEGRHAIILLKGVHEPSPSNPWTNLVMFLLTVLSMTFVGAISVYTGDATTQQEAYREIIANLATGLPFAISLLAILLAHEFGHYIAGRIHKAAVTLPYFIPLPIPPFGTLGAFIQLKSAPKNKRELLDIGIAGPIAGFVVAIPILLYGLSLSEVHPLPNILLEGQGLSLEGNSLLYLLAKYVVHGQWLPAPVDYGTVSPALYWLKYFFTGQPVPLGGVDVLVHPIAWAGWGGLLVTALNLIPAGQLDGGHIAYVLFGKATSRIRPFVFAFLFGMGFLWQGWWFWAFILTFFGRSHAEPLDQITQLDQRRKIIAVIGIIIFIITFAPIPLSYIPGPFVG